MSLLDSLLLDPYRDSREAWIAIRSDGQPGTGTIADPFDGSKKAGPPVAAFLTLKWTEFVVELGNIAANLPYFDPVKSKLRFEGVTGPAKDWFNYSGNGNEFGIGEVTRYQTIIGQPPSARGFVVAPVDPDAGAPASPPNVQFTWNGFINTKYTYTDMNGQLAVGPPFNLSARIVWPAAKLAFFTAHGLVNFDAIELSNFGGNDSHFNGTYVLAGQSDKSVRIRLSDRSQDLPLTDISVPVPCVLRKLTYRFDQIMRSAPEYALFHLGPGTFETRGFAPTYISSQNDGRETFVGFVLRFGQRLCGSGIGASVVQLALPVDELSNTVAIGNPSTNSADFSEVADLTIDCNAPGHPVPYGIFPAPVTCGAVNLGGSFIALRRVRAINFCTQAAAECFVLGLAHETNPVAASYLPTGTFNVIEDCILEQPGENNTHETTLISSVGNGYGSARSPVVRRNYVNCSYSNGYSSEFVAIQGITYDGVDAVVTTKRPHGRTLNSVVSIQGVWDGDNLLPTPFNGAFPVTSVVSATQFKILRPAGAPTEASLRFFGYGASASIGVRFHAPAALSGTGCVTEGNAVYDCTVGYYTDTGSTRDTVVRDNYYSSIVNGVSFDFNPGLLNLGGTSDPRTAERLTRSVDANGRFIATFEIPDSSPPLEVSVDDAVRVSGALRNGQVINPYNGNFSITTVSTIPGLSGIRKFSYVMTEDPGGPAENPPTTDPNDPDAILFRSRWQVRRLSYEGNICDFYAFEATTAFPPIGVTQFGYLQGPPFMFPQGVHRDNVFRLIDGAPAVPMANGGRSIAFALSSSQDILVEGNVIGIVDPYVMLYLKSRNVNMFNNLTPAGEAVPLSEDTSGFGATFERRDTFDDKINDALLFSLL